MFFHQTARFTCVSPSFRAKHHPALGQSWPSPPLDPDRLSWFCHQLLIQKSHQIPPVAAGRPMAHFWPTALHPIFGQNRVEPHSTIHLASWCWSNILEIATWELNPPAGIWYLYLRMMNCRGNLTCLTCSHIDLGLTGLHARITKCHLVTLHWEVSSQVITSQQRFSCTADPGWHADSLTNLQWILYSHALPTSQVRSCWTCSPMLGWHCLHRVRARQGPSGPHVARCSNIGRGGNPNLQTWANVLDLKANSGNSKCRCFFFIQHNEQNERLTNIHWDIKFENISNKKQWNIGYTANKHYICVFFNQPKWWYKTSNHSGITMRKSWDWYDTTDIDFWVGEIDRNGIMGYTQNCYLHP